MDYSVLIKRIREHMRISQQALANQLGVSFVTINRWENGNQKPSALAQKMIQQLCRTHNIPTD